MNATKRLKLFSDKNYFKLFQLLFFVKQKIIKGFFCKKKNTHKNTILKNIIKFNKKYNIKLHEKYVFVYKIQNKIKLI